MRDRIGVAVNKYLIKFNNEYMTLTTGLDNPEIILTELYNPDDHQPFYNYITTALRKEGIDNHDLQRHLISKVKKYFSEFDDEVEIEMLYNSYPASLVVKYEGYKILSFSFYYHTYTDEVPRTRVNYLENQIEASKERVGKLEEQETIYESYLDNKLLMLNPKNYKSKGFKLMFRLIHDSFLLIWNWRVVGRNLNGRLQRCMRLITDEHEDIRKYEEQIDELNKVMPTLASKYQKWEEKMIELGYKKD